MIGEMEELEKQYNFLKSDEKQIEELYKPMIQKVLTERDFENLRLAKINKDKSIREFALKLMQEFLVKNLITPTEVYNSMPCSIRKIPFHEISLKEKAKDEVINLIETLEIPKGDNNE
jgi:hypothetical protein